ncbi:UNVERIFIED_CONTAM: glycosyl transferase family 2, partial [Bacteroidetes bacterium 56_B9]
MLKGRGPVWLGFSRDVRSVRASPHFAEVGQMISRSAYAQLNYSPLLLLGTLLGMALVYLVPVVITLTGPFSPRLMALAAWVLIAVAFQPTLR